MDTLYTVWLSGTIYYMIDYAKFTSKKRISDYIQSSESPATAFIAGIALTMILWPFIFLGQALNCMGWLPESAKNVLRENSIEAGKASPVDSKFPDNDPGKMYL